VIRFGQNQNPSFIKMNITTGKIHVSETKNGIYLLVKSRRSWGWRSYVIWPNYGFSSWLWQNQISKNQLWRHFVT